MIEPETAAQRFHEAYERLAPSFGYTTREASAVPWADVPAQNKALMVAVCAEILPEIAAAALRVMADEIDRGPTFPLPPSVISALVRERADRLEGR